MLNFFIILGVALIIAGGVVLAIRLVHLKALRVIAEQPDPELVKRAVKIVWVEEYGMRIEDLPRLVWMTGKELNCADGRGWMARAEEGKICVAGLSWKATWTSSIAWYPGAKMWVVAFAHELRHAKSWIDGSTNDHLSAEFQADVAKANAALEARL